MILVLKYLRSYIKIYETLTGALMLTSPLHVHSPTLPPNNMYETLAWVWCFSMTCNIPFFWIDSLRTLSSFNFSLQLWDKSWKWHWNEANCSEEGLLKLCDASATVGREIQVNPLTLGHMISLGFEGRFYVSKRGGIGGGGWTIGHSHDMLYIWWQSWLAVERPWSALAGPILSFLAQMGTKALPILVQSSLEKYEVQNGQLLLQ